MEHVPGRVFKDPLLPGFTPEERKQVYQAMVDVLAKIHRVNIQEAELQDYGKQGDKPFHPFSLYSQSHIIFSCASIKLCLKVAHVKIKSSGIKDSFCR